MRSIILCEGPDDLWFSAYYLNKVAGWDTCTEFQLKKHWSSYRIPENNKKQKVYYMSHNDDSVAIWCVAGKDAFDSAIETVLHQFVDEYPADPINSLVILRDRDTDTEADVISHFSSVFGNDVTLANQLTSVYTKTIDGIAVFVNITPVIVPFDDCGAIESLLMAAVSESSDEGRIVVENACAYVDGLNGNPVIGHHYLKHEREIVKAKFAATIAVTNPGHSTGLFQDLVQLCPWEKSDSVKRHFDVVLNAVTTT